jgi:hypothetical protein
MNFTSHSYAYADIFALEFFGEGGSYLEIGAGPPVKGGNNTALLELNGWTGHSFDLSPNFKKQWEESWRDFSRFHHEDALKYDWSTLDQKHFNFVQFDIEPAHKTFTCFKNVIQRDGITADFITFEHDLYVNPLVNMAFKNDAADILKALGYTRIFEDVPTIFDPKLTHEDWYVSDKVNPPKMRFADWCRSVENKHCPHQKRVSI